MTKQLENLSELIQGRLGLRVIAVMEDEFDLVMDALDKHPNPEAQALVEKLAPPIAKKFIDDMQKHFYRVGWHDAVAEVIKKLDKMENRNG